MSNQNAFAYDLLVRCTEIQQTVSVTDAGGVVHSVKFAQPRWWAPIGNNPFPGFFNRVKRTNSTPSGRPIRKDLYQVDMRLVIGPAFAGYQGEYEDLGNLLYLATINTFDVQQRLAVPSDAPNNEPLQFVESARILIGDAGIEGKAYNNNPQDVYLCLDIPLEVTAIFNVPRQS